MSEVYKSIAETLQQAVAFHQNGQLQDAERIYRDILQSHPNHPEANHNMGVLAVQKMQPAIGLPHFMAALEADPTRGQYWLSYIDALLQAGQTEAAREVLTIARHNGLQGDDIDAMELRMGEGKNPGSHEITTLVTLFNAGRYAEVATLAQEMTVRYPQYGFGWGTLGAALKQMGRTEEARLAMQTAVELSPDDAEIHNNLGISLYELGRLTEAEKSLRRALEIKPDFAEAHYNMGLTLKALGRLDEAEAGYRRALEIKPGYTEAHSNLGNILKELGRLDEAVASYKRALEIKPEYAEAHNNLGATLLDFGRLDEAESSLRRALEINEDYADAHNNLGSTLLDLGRLNDAETSTRRALQLKPDFADAHYNLGIILKNIGRLEEAEASYRRGAKAQTGFRLGA